MAKHPYVSIQGEWGVTAQQEAEETKRVQEFQETVPKMRSQLRVLTHLYQVARLHSGGGVSYECHAHYCTYYFET